MKNITYILLLNTVLINTASSGPLHVGNFSPEVNTAVTNRFKDFLQSARDANGGEIPSGSIATMLRSIADKSVTPYFEEHPVQLAASSKYIDQANKNSIVLSTYNEISRMSASIEMRSLLWHTLLLAASEAYDALQKEAIPKLNLNIPTVTGTILLNQQLIFSPDEMVSYGGEIAAEISIIQLIFNEDKSTFFEMFKKWLPTD